jgi:hypothetical protein
MSSRPLSRQMILERATSSLPPTTRIPLNRERSVGEELVVQGIGAVCGDVAVGPFGDWIVCGECLIGVRTDVDEEGVDLDEFVSSRANFSQTAVARGECRGEVHRPPVGPFGRRPAPGTQSRLDAASMARLTMWCAPISSDAWRREMIGKDFFDFTRISLRYQFAPALVQFDFADLPLAGVPVSAEQNNQMWRKPLPKFFK